VIASFLLRVCADGGLVEVGLSVERFQLG
jgi:hypothetical protein